MPKFNLTTVNQRASSQPLAFAPQTPDTGESLITNAMQNFGNALGQIGEKVIAAETAESVSTATGEAARQLGALNNDQRLKGMSLPDAVAEYDPRAKEIGKTLGATLSPAARQVFNRNWAGNSATSAVAFRSAATQRAIGQVDATNKLNIDAINNAAGNTPIVASNGTLHQKMFDQGIASIKHLAVTGIIDAKVAADRIMKFGETFAKQSIAGYLGRNQAIETLEGISDAMKEDGKGLPGPVKAIWDRLDATDKATFKSKALTDMSRIQSALDKADTAREKAAKTARVQTGAAYIVSALAVEDNTASDEQADQVSRMSPDWIEDQVKIGNIEGKDGIALQKIMTGLDGAKTDLPAFINMSQRIYAIADLPEDLRQAEIEAMSANIAFMVGGPGERSRLTGGDAKHLYSLLETAKDDTFKKSPQFQARRTLERSLGVTSTGAAMFSFLEDKDGQKAIRIQSALREYDIRVNRDGDNPWEVASDLIDRSAPGGRVLSSFTKLRFGPKGIDPADYTSEHLDEALDNTVSALKRKKIKPAAAQDIFAKIKEMRKLVKENDDAAEALRKAEEENKKSGRGVPG